MTSHFNMASSRMQFTTLEALKEVMNHEEVDSESSSFDEYSTDDVESENWCGNARQLKLKGGLLRT